jgi:hypothetical protein
MKEKDIKPGELVEAHRYVHFGDGQSLQIILTYFWKDKESEALLERLDEYMKDFTKTPSINSLRDGKDLNSKGI